MLQVVKNIVVIKFTILKLRKIGDDLLSLCILVVWVKRKKIQIFMIIIILFIRLVVVCREFSTACLGLLSHA